MLRDAWEPLGEPKTHQFTVRNLRVSYAGDGDEPTCLVDALLIAVATYLLEMTLPTLAIAVENDSR